MFDHPELRDNHGAISKWAVVVDNNVEWGDTYEDMCHLYEEHKIYGVMQLGEEWPVRIMYNGEEIKLMDTPPHMAVILFNNLICDRETARE